MNVLFISIALPPKNDPECIQTGKYLKYLLTSKDLNFEVITSKSPTLFMPIDKKLMDFSSLVDNMVELPIYENKYLSWLLRKVGFGPINQPDSKFTFHRQWRRSLKLIQNKPDLIYSRAFPLSSTVMACKLAEHFKVPWIMHMSDPWYYSPLHSYSKKDAEWNKKWEGKCLELAEAVCFTSQECIQLYSVQYPDLAKKFYWFPNVYDPDEIVDTKKYVAGERLRFVYTGGLAGKRSAKFIISSLEILFRNRPDLEQKIEFIFAGGIDRQNKFVFEQCGLSNVHHLGELPKDTAIELQRTAHALLVIDNPFNKEGDAVFLPSKLMDYMITKSRIIGITTKNSSTETFLNQIGESSVYYPDSTSFIRLIQHFYDAYVRGDENYFTREDMASGYSASENATRLASFFKQIKYRRNSNG